MLAGKPDASRSLRTLVPEPARSVKHVHPVGEVRMLRARMI